MSNNRDGQVALITGGSAGLGWAIARRAAELKMRVAIASNEAEPLARAVEELRGMGVEALGVEADVTRDDDVARLIDETVGRFGRLDLLINNVGRSTRGAAVETTVEQFRDLLEINFLSAVRCTRAALPHLVCQKGHLVNIGSLGAKSPGRFMGAYPASKYAVAAYSHQLRLELAAEGVHVLLVCPGPLARPDAGVRYDEQSQGLPEDARKPGGGVKLRRLDPAEVARRIFLACDRRQPELVIPAKARWLFAVSQLWPSLGDWILGKST